MSLQVNPSFQGCKFISPKVIVELDNLPKKGFKGTIIYKETGKLKQAVGLYINNPNSEKSKILINNFLKKIYKATQCQYFLEEAKSFFEKTVK